MKFLRSILKWRRKDKIPPNPTVGVVIYRWISLLPSVLSPYTYVFRISPANPDRGFSSARRVRKIVFSQLHGKNSFVYANEVDHAADIWNEIIPSTNRPATHKIEIGVLRKASGLPRSAFFVEYFCFESKSKTSDRIAIQIAGFLADQLDRTTDFSGEAIKDAQQTYWLLCIFAAWKQFRR